MKSKNKVSIVRMIFVRMYLLFLSKYLVVHAVSFHIVQN